ncbi:MAG: DUF5677 domain-containing protein [Bifidobacteriaceae bacterium]|jgi:hypothetical protein|nr:DUF5677 domain-containing protein [Bifidobacteriaceae bacterium]
MATADPDTLEELLTLLEEFAEQRGIELEAAMERVTKPVASALVELGRRIAARIVEGARSAASREAADKEEFIRGLQTDWGQALDEFEAGIVLAEQTAHRLAVPSDRRDQLGELLLTLTGAALRTSREVLWLLRGGFPFGAMARSRTVHEHAVTCAVLGSFGRQPGYEDLAERFALHESVLVSKEYKDLPDDAPADFVAGVESARTRADELKRRWGSDYASPYGWAATAAGQPRPHFDDLERLAEACHRRDAYRLSSHFVHADALGTALNRADIRGQTIIMTGPMNLGLGEPAVFALGALADCLTALA